MGWCIKPTELKFHSILHTENFDALQTDKKELFTIFANITLL